ncbi:hypothetical protein CORC01_13287 [Colletotrichum orchidophilum]|uniref:Uncharacterized protein n=1 Tax=Colletotrichum orchidophilum TaxID=1209926 RepID=A0A1G4AQX3_9PEZI|nr:uncharacterized protein CORC01_13287 [Colletotrichum orchidophilum]OHE91422.1 hypothetical protein CORC01_13287 [Colletotrichum orchidophilum]
MWTSLLRQDERCCLAICLAVNYPHSGLTEDTWYPPFDKVKEDINSDAGHRFVAYVIGSLCGPLRGKEFVVKVAALLACLKIRNAHGLPDGGLLGNRTNLLFEFDKALNFDLGNIPVVVNVLEQVLMFSARIWEIHAPEDAIQPGLLPPSLNLYDDSVSRKMLYMYCCVRILFPDTHESSMHRTRAVFQLNTAGAPELFLDTLSDDELESAGHSMCDADEDLLDEYVGTSNADSGFVESSELSGESFESNAEEEEDDIV